MNEFERFKEDDIDLIDVVNKLKSIVFSNLKLLITSGVIILLFTILYLFNTPKQYNTYAKIKVLEKDETSAFVLEDMMNFDSPFKNEEILENEIEILKSKTILESVIDKLKLNHFYAVNSYISISNLQYNQIPYNATISASDNEQEFTIIANTKEQFTITNINDKSAKAVFGKAFILGGDTIKINKSEWFTSESVDQQFSLTISDRFKTFLSLKKRLSLSSITDAVLQLSIKGEDPELNTKIIKALLSAYNDDGINDNKMLSQSTSSFLTERISLIKSDITLLETTLSDIKKGNDVFDISAINSIFSSQKLVSNEMNFEIETQVLLANSFYNKLQNHNYTNLLPLPMEVGIENSELANFTAEFNNIVIERNKLLKGRTTENPEIQLLNTQLNNLLSNLNISVINYINNLGLKQNKISDYDNNLESEFYKLNDTELTIVKLSREVEVKASILLFLLEKQEENALKLAVNIPTFKILDAPYTDFTNPKPNTTTSLIIGLLLALLLPIIFVFVRTALYDKITDKKSIETILDNNIPIIGEIPLTNEKIIQSGVRGALIESFRLIRTNLNYLSDKNKVIMITSSIKGEGKTFTAINLAQSLASAKGNKVLVLGLDLRNPQIHTYLDINKDEQNGITNYLINNSQDIDSLISKNDNVDFDFMLSGPIPPNPSELLLSEKLEEIIQFGKQNYDYVIIDSAPCLLVSDSLNLIKYTDTTIYLTKSRHTDLELIKYINKLSEDKIINNIAVIINGLKENGNHYSYNYGYNYGYES